MMLLKCCTHYASNTEKISSDHRTGKSQFSFQSQRRAKPKNVQTITFISHASKVMLKILQARLQQYVNQELPGVQARFRKGRGTREQLANICEIIEKAREYRKTSTSVSLTMLKLLTVWITKNLWKILKETGIPDYLTCLMRNGCASQEATVTNGVELVPNWKRRMSRLYIVTLFI